MDYGFNLFLNSAVEGAAERLQDKPPPVGTMGADCDCALSVSLSWGSSSAAGGLHASRDHGTHARDEAQPHRLRGFPCCG